MSTELETGMQGHLATLYWGGREKGGMIQITTREGRDDYLQLDLAEAKELVSVLSVFIEREERKRELSTNPKGDAKMTYKDCIVTTIEYTVAGDEEFSNISCKRDVYDTEGSISSENPKVNSNGISTLLEEIDFYAGNVSDYLYPLEAGAQVKVVLWHPEEGEEGSIQVTTTPQKVSTKDIEDILNGMMIESRG